MKKKEQNVLKILSFITLFMIISGVLGNGCGPINKKEIIPPPPDNFFGLRKIIDHPSEDMFPEVSPNSALVSYASRKGEHFDIFFFDPYKPKVNVVQATRHISDDICPSWSADSKEIYFTSARLKTLSIWRTPVQGGSGKRQITVREDANDFDSSISPDGTKMVFCSLHGCKEDVLKNLFKIQIGQSSWRRWLKSKNMIPTLWISNIDGSMMTQIGSGYNPRWSPDGSKILFHKPAGDNMDIWMIKPDGTELTQLTTDSADDKDASWSPDGTKIAFSSNRQGSYATDLNFDIWVIDLQVNQRTQLTYDPKDDGAPFWARSGYIYFHSDRDGKYDIFVGKPKIPWEKGQ